MNATSEATKTSEAFSQVFAELNRLKTSYARQTQELKTLTERLKTLEADNARLRELAAVRDERIRSLEAEREARKPRGLWARLKSLFAR